MAKGTVIEPDYVRQLATALGRELKNAQVEHEHVRGERYRFQVIWSQFDRMGHPERQKRVWDIAERVLNKTDLVKVTMILTLGSSDVAAD